MTADLHGDRWAGRDHPAWHDLGQVFTEDLAPQQALELACCDFDVVTCPITIQTPWGDIPADDRVAIVRQPLYDDPNPVRLGIAGSRYTPLQNREIAAMLAPITISQDHPTGIGHLETVGSLGQGEQFFMTLKMAKSTIAGDEIDNYLLAYNSHTGKDAAQLAFTMVRVVCQNTLTLGLKQASLLTSIPHFSDVHAETQFRLDIMASMERTKKRMETIFNRMAQVRLDQEQIQQVLKATHPDPTTPGRVRLLADIGDTVNGLPSERVAGLQTAANNHATAIKRAQTLREWVLQAMDEFNQEKPAYADSAWSFINAASAVSGWREGRDNHSASESAVFGPRSQEVVRAFDALLPLVR